MTGPQRTCAGCRRKAPPEDLLRIAAPPGGGVRIGRGVPGRGAWVCSAGCFDLAIKRGALSRALRRAVSNDEVDALRATLFG